MTRRNVIYVVANIAENLVELLTLDQGWGIVACPVIQAIGRPDFEDGLRTRSPGEVVSD